MIHLWFIRRLKVLMNEHEDLIKSERVLEMINADSVNFV